jgi:choline dehydrogenase-like flavoprotein
MLLDARSIPPGETLSTDVCIIGGGAAGISIALALAGDSARVLLLESGGLTADEAVQELYQGAATGHPYYELDACRLRLLGGSTNFWGGWCRPLDAVDFEQREWVPHSGWPFGREELDAYYARAHGVCRLGPYDYDPRHWREERDSLVPDQSAVLTDTVFQIAPTRFGVEHSGALRQASNVQLMLHANALEIEMDAPHRSAARLHVVTLAGNRFPVAARLFVLAAGGIENPRLLLASRRGRQCGIGNERDLVGRFFADHLHVPIGTLRSRRGCVPAFYQVQRARAATVRGGLALTENIRSRKRLPGCALTLHNAEDPHDVLSPTRQPEGYESLRFLMKAARRRERPRQFWRHVGNVVTGLDAATTLSYRALVKRPPRTVMVGCRAEQVPNRNSRVTLDDSTDCFGMPRARLHWDLTDQDRAGVERALHLCAAALEDRQVETQPMHGLADGGWMERIAGGAHHTGTTRMHRDPARGVVDEHCRVHGTSNLYVAGSSVFPTAGWAPPTLTIVALALRLADHLKARLAGDPGPRA